MAIVLSRRLFLLTIGSEIRPHTVKQWVMWVMLALGLTGLRFELTMVDIKAVGGLCSSCRKR